jgi:hypothetical protein
MTKFNGTYFCKFWTYDGRDIEFQVIFVIENLVKIQNMNEIIFKTMFTLRPTTHGTLPYP